MHVSRTLAGWRHVFGKVSGTTLVPSAFNDRLTPALTRMMKRVLGEILEQAEMLGRQPLGTLAPFQKVVATDLTVIRLHDLLKKKWPACRTNHTLAALKAHVILSVVGTGSASVNVASQRVHDGLVLRAGEWVKSNHTVNTVLDWG